MNSWEPASIRVAQLGARMHYAVPRILASAGLLESLYTDVYAGDRWDRLASFALRLNGPSFARFLDRRGPGIPESRVIAHPVFGALYYLKQRNARNAAEREDVHQWAGRKFAGLASKNLRKAKMVYGFNSAALELFKAGKRDGVQTVLEMTIAPREAEDRFVEAALERWPHWRVTCPRTGHRAASIRREREEWRWADRIVCASSFVRDCLGTLGGPLEKCSVVPYGVELPPLRAPRRRTGRALRVLTAGTVSIRKGIPAVLEAARLAGPGFEFRIAGAGVLPVGEPLPSNVSLTGPVPRSTMGEQYRWADVFLLPSICEGSATVTYEALGHGLPVICTPNTGSVVRDGIGGYLVPILDPVGIVEVLARIAKVPDLLEFLSDGARCQAERWDLHAYSVNLRRTLGIPLGDQDAR